MGWLGYGPQVQYFAVGFNVVQSPASVGSGTSQVTLTIDLWGKSFGYGHDFTATALLGGALSGSIPFSFYSPFGGTVEKKLGTRTLTVPTKYAQSVKTALSASVAFWGGTAKVSQSWTTGARPYAAPAAPPAPSVAQSGDEMALSWAYSWASNVGGSRKFNVQRWVEGGSWTTIKSVGESVRAYTDVAPANTRVWYRLQAVSAGGTTSGGYPAELYTTLAPPAQVVAERESATSIRVSWSNQAPFATGFEVWDRPGGAAPVLVGTSSGGGFTHTSANVALTHQYYVVATRGSMKSAASPLSAVVQLAAPPNAPANLSPNGAIVSDGVPLRLSWSHRPVDASAQTKAEVRYRYGGGAWTTIAVAGSAQYLSLALSAGSMEWQVRSWGVHATASPWSPIATVTLIAVPIATVIAPTGTVFSSTFTVSWAVVQDQGLPQSAWRVAIVDGGGQVLFQREGTGSATSTIVSAEIASGESYTVQVMVAASGVWSDPAESTFQVLFVPPAAPILDAYWDEEHGRVVLSGVPSPDPVVAYSWTGVAGQSASVEIVDGVETRRNEVPNPSFETGTAEWTGYPDDTFISTTAFVSQMWPDYGGASGARLGQYTAGGARPAMNVYTGHTALNGNKFVALNLLAASEADCIVRAGVCWTDGTSTLATEWLAERTAYYYVGRRFAGVLLSPPAGATHYRVIVNARVEGVTPMPAGKRLWIDRVIACSASTEAEALSLAEDSYFDGDTPGVPAATRIELYRRLPGANEFELLETQEGAPGELGIEHEDWEAPSAGATEYRLVAYTPEGALAATNVLVRAASPAIWLSGGPGFTTTARLAYGLGDRPKISIEAGRERSAERYSGRPLAVAYSGVHTILNVRASGAIVEAAHDNAIQAALQDLAQIAEPVFLLRLPTGHRVYGTLLSITMPNELATAWSWSLQMEETERGEQ